MNDYGIGVNNSELARNSIILAIQKADMENIPYCEAGVLSAVDQYILEVKNQNNGHVTDVWVTSVRNKYKCDCEFCS